MKPYQPSNGSEGDFFEDKFCYRCRFWRMDKKIGTKGCPINDASMVFDPTNKFYPSEWVCENDNSNPRCTKFILKTTELKTLPLTDEQADWIKKQTKEIIQ